MTDPYTSPIRFKPRTELGPIEEAAEYVNHRWVQALQPLRTACYQCGKDSPIIFTDKRGAIAFGDARMLGRGQYKYADITDEVKMKFAELGWKFQLRRSYCPQCKGLGSV